MFLLQLLESSREDLAHLHFANEIWRNPIGEVMGHAGTAQENFDMVVAFAASIRMIPVKVLKGQPGYLLNSMLVPLLVSVEQLWATALATSRTSTGLGALAPVRQGSVPDSGHHWPGHRIQRCCHEPCSEGIPSLYRVALLPCSREKID